MRHSLTLRPAGNGIPAHRRLGVLLAALALPLARLAAAEIPVEGVTDKSVTADRVTFRVPASAGFTEVAYLDSQPVTLNASHVVDAPDYHELLVQRSPAVGGATESRLVRFIVRASERANTEWGLPPWTPPALIDSSPGELLPARVRLLVPLAFPTGLPVPVVAWLDAPDGHALRANTRLSSALHEPIRLRRGVGSGWIPARGEPGLVDYAATLPGHDVRRGLRFETAVWRDAGGSLTTDTVWAADSRLSVTGTVTIPAGITLTVGAGSVVRLAAGVDVAVNGRLRLEGTTERPVVFTPADAAKPWGGFLVRGATAQFEATGAIFVGSGANASWFSQNSGYDVHRKEQALLLVDGARATLTDCAAFDGHGQFGHGRNANLELERCLVQRFITAGEYNGGSVRLHDSALIEFPSADAPFADADNDGIYFTSGHHVVADTLIGWTGDDGIDAGSGSTGSVLATNVWIEGNYHEAFAWSGGGRSVTNLHCVALHCGQGIECGWSTGSNSPLVHADDCLSLGNGVGLRFGDNYDWTYNGFLRVTNSLVLHNRRDIFGLNWSDWTWRLAQMDIQGNLLTAANTNHPANSVWVPARDAARLASFSNVAPDAPPGIGFATRALQADLSTLGRGLVVGLSRFATGHVEIRYTVEQPDQPATSGALAFEPGETLKNLPLATTTTASTTLVRVTLSEPRGAVLTGPAQFHFTRTAGAPATLIPTGSIWRYRDNGIDPGDAWTMPDYDDSGWKTGPAELGYGDGDEATVVEGGPSSARRPTTWFRRRFVVDDPSRFAELEVRLRRDDGALVHLNGNEALRSNLPEGPITAATYTGTGTTSETDFFTQRVPGALLRPGTNVVAVEVHQANATSSDLSFELELVAYPALRIDLARFGTETPVMLWDDAQCLLESAPALGGPWRTDPAVTSPFAPTEAGASFHRLRRR